MKELIDKLNKLDDVQLVLIVIVTLAMLKHRDNQYKEQNGGKQND